MAGASPGGIPDPDEATEEEIAAVTPQDLRDLFDADDLEEATEEEVAAVTSRNLHSLFDHGYLRRNGIAADDGSGGQA